MAIQQNERGRDLRAVITAAAVELVNEQGLTAVAMSHVAERAGITRATLYKYFPDVRAILEAYQEQQVAQNLAALVAARNEGNCPRDRLASMLEAFALMVHRQHTAELAVFLNSSEHAGRGYAELGKMLREVIGEGARGGSFRQDVPAGELASFCTSALTAAASVGSAAAARRLARVALSAVCAKET